MRWILAIAMAMAVLLVCGMGESSAAVKKTGPDVQLNDTGRWEVLCKVWFFDGSWTWGYLRWTGVQGEINWANAVVCCLQGTGNGFQPEPRWNLVGSRLEIVGDSTPSTR